MTRPSFSTTLPGLARGTWDNGGDTGWYFATDCRRTSETVSGTSRRKPQGWIPPTGYHLSRVEVLRANGTMSYMIHPVGNWTKWEGYVGASGFNSLNHFNEVIDDYTANQPLSSNTALIKARVKLKDKKVDLGVAFAERKATANSIGDTAKRLARSVRELRHGNFRNAARALGVIHDPGKPKGSNWTNHWLQLQYAWKPLLSDVYGSVDALSKRERSDWRVTAKATVRDNDSWTVRREPYGSTYPQGNYDACNVVAVRRRGVLVRIDAVPDNDLKMSLVSLGITNPLVVAWEVVPYSFVVDWFLPIGAWLDSLDAMLGYTQCYTSITTFNETKWTDTGVSKVWPSGTYVKNSWTGTKRNLEVHRSASSGVPLPSFPGFKDPRSLGHMANGLSLLAQAFGRR